MKGYIITTSKGKVVTPILYKTKKSAEKDIIHYTNFTKSKCKVVNGRLEVDIEIR